MTHAAQYAELQPDLFVTPSDLREAGLEKQREAERAERRARRMLQQDAARVDHSAELKRLEPVAIVVGCERPTFTMADVRTRAEELGLLTGEEGRPNPGNGRMETPRALAFLGALLPGLARIHFVEKFTDESGRTVYETSERARANGNKQALWRATERAKNARIVSGGSLIELREIILAYRESGVSRG